MVLGSGEREIQRNLWRGARVEAVMGGGLIGYDYGYQNAIVPYQQVYANGQTLTPYQQQFAANQQAAGVAREQYYPLAERNRHVYGRELGQSSCNLM